MVDWFLIRSFTASFHRSDLKGSFGTRIRFHQVPEGPVCWMLSNWPFLLCRGKNWSQNLQYLQLVGASEAFSTVVPRADKGSITRVPTQMSSKVWSLSIDFSAALVVADMDFTLVLSNPTKRINKIHKDIDIIDAKYKKDNLFLIL